MNQHVKSLEDRLVCLFERKANEFARYSTEQPSTASVARQLADLYRVGRVGGLQVLHGLDIPAHGNGNIFRILLQFFVFPIARRKRHHDGRQDQNG